MRFDVEDEKYAYVADGLRGISVINCRNISNIFIEKNVFVDGWAMFFI